MDTIQKAHGVLRATEESLRDLIRTAVEEQRYAEIAEIAELANSVSKLIRGATPAPRVAAAEPHAGNGIARSSPPPRLKKKVAKKKLASKSEYPWFGRDGDRLVKVGWSKKNKKEYEHRVGRDVVQAFAKHLDSAVTAGEMFDVDGLLPIVDPAGDEIPGYQIYVALAWLRSIDVIEKKGRDGYVLRRPEALRGDMNEIWNDLRARST